MKLKIHLPRLIAQWPYLTCGYHNEPQRYRIFPSLQKVPLDSTDLKRKEGRRSVHRILSTTNNEEFEVENGAIKETGEEMEKLER